MVGRDRDGDFASLDMVEWVCSAWVRAREAQLFFVCVVCLGELSVAGRVLRMGIMRGLAVLWIK
jgi:hypothetical protein